MNFLLYMLGRAARITGGLRPDARQQLMVTAARTAAAGDWPAALEAYRTLSDAAGSTPLDALIRGHLHGVLGESREAALHFAEGITRLHQTRASDGHSPTALERLLNQSDQLLVRGSYDEAITAIRKARALLEVILAAEAGLLLAWPQVPADAALTSLCHLSDLTLRLLARTQVAGRLAGALRERCLPDADAPWATSAESVQSMLQAEYARLEAGAATLAGHAESQFRLGLVARAVGEQDRAAAAFRRVLAVHPYHVASAVRLAAADPKQGAAALERAFKVPAETLDLFRQFAAAAGAAEPFDAASERLCLQGTTARTCIRGNLAFALAELSLLDESREEWREPAPA